MEKKYFNFENSKKICNRLLTELDISGLPTLGVGVDFGLGEICLEESDGKYRFYFAAGRDKFHYREFDNIEGGINELVEYYKAWNMVDKPNKMERIIYQELGLEHNIFTCDRCDVNKFFEKYSESRELTRDELKALYSLNQILEENGVSFEVEFDIGYKLGKNCIFKIDDDSWVVWKPVFHTENGCLSYFPMNFDNVNEACQLILDRCCIDEDIIDEFPKYYDSLLLTDKQLDDFSKQMVYTEAIPSKTRKKFLYIK